MITFIDRGDVDTFDFDIGDFTVVDVWTDLDLSTIIPPGTTAVLLRIWLKFSNVRSYFKFRTKGNVNAINVSSIFSQVINTEDCADMIVPTKGQQIIQYLCDRRINVTISFTVGGWYK